MSSKIRKAKIWLPSIFSNNMMLQADKENLIWGKAKPGRKIIMTIAGKKAKGTAGENGCFKITLPALSAGGPYTLNIDAGKKMSIKNILAGDVWLCSGQSNMDMMVKDSFNAVREIQEAKYRGIRIFTVPRAGSFKPYADVNGKWSEVTPKSIENFSAVGYFFGRELHKTLRKPVGLINSSYGGTEVAMWMSGDALNGWDKYPAIKKLVLEKLKKQKKGKKVKPGSVLGVHNDTGNEGLTNGYAGLNCPVNEWKTFRFPGYWTENGLDFVGALWFRKEVNIPASWLGFDLALELGPIVDFDDAYFNGEKVGTVKEDIPLFWSYNRRYLIPARLLVAGRNVIAVRIFAHMRVGGVAAAKGVMGLSVINKPGIRKISIEGNWKYMVERKLHRIILGTDGYEGLYPSNLYNAMLSPIVGFGLKGIIWYQGESDTYHASEYKKLMELFIGDLRGKWGGEELPFYFTQIANFGLAGTGWPELREEQVKTLSIKNTGMAVTIDIGETADIHPKNKQDVGKRLALNALALTYGKNIEYSGPIYSAMKKEGRCIRLSFSHAESGLALQSGKDLLGFEIAGKKGGYVFARAKIKGSTVVVNSGKVKDPVSVRYAWAADPKCNLINKAGLPASPFRTRDRE